MHIVFMHVQLDLICACVNIQSNMYQPMEHRKEVAREQQRDMEQAFERLFVQTHGKIHVYFYHPTLSVVMCIQVYNNKEREFKQKRKETR